MYQTELREKRPTPAGRLDSSAQTYVLVSKVAYLAGVERRIFENEYEPPKMEYFSQMDGNPNARIIRNLSMLRTAIEQNYSELYHAMRYDLKNLDTLPALIPTECLTVLKQDGIPLVKANHKLNHYIIDINRHIANRINLCKDLFPLWLNWSYLRELFLMPDGYTESGIKRAANTYYAHKYQYPYQVYLNWSASNEGNILYNDKKFAVLLYRWHNDYFHEFSKVSDVSSYVKGSIYEYIEGSEKAVVVVDCENSDPYKLCAVLKNLDYKYTQKISNIILFDDIHTASAWRILEDFTKIPVEHILIERVKESKSLVDIKLTARACQEHYINKVDSFIIVSSDSDYWGLISSLPDARFLMMIEHEKSGPDLKAALVNTGIFYCYIDDFYSGNAEDLKFGALIKEMYRYIDSAVHLNVNDMFSAALKATRIEMSEAEKKQYMSQHIKTMQMSIAPDGEVVLSFKHK